MIGDDRPAAARAGRSWMTLLTVAVRTARPRTLVGGAVGILAFAVVAEIQRASSDGTLRWTSLAIAIVVAFGVEEEAAPLVAASPIPLWTRRAWRLAVLAVWAGVVWMAAWLVARPTELGVDAHVGWLAMLSVASLAAALAAGRRDEGSAGVVGSMCALVLFTGAVVVPRHWPVVDVLSSTTIGRDLIRVGVTMGIVACVALRDPSHRSWRGMVMRLNDR